MKRRLFVMGMAMVIFLGSGCGAKDTAVSEPEANQEPVYEESVKDSEVWVNVAYADEVVTEATEYDWFTADNSPDATKVIFMAEGNVRDFKFLSLFCEDVLEDGTPVFTVEELYQTDSLTPEKHLLVEMTFGESIPSYGYSFVDDNGETQRFTLEMSGMDGSIYIGEF